MLRCGTLNPMLMQMILKCCLIDVELMMVCSLWQFFVSRYWTSSYRRLLWGYEIIDGEHISLYEVKTRRWYRLVQYRGHSKRHRMFLQVDAAKFPRDVRQWRDSAIDCFFGLLCVGIQKLLDDGCYHLASVVLSLADSDIPLSVYKTWASAVVRFYGGMDASKALSVSSYVSDWWLMLLKLGVHPDEIAHFNINNVTILMEASRHGDECLVRTLLENGSAPNFKNDKNSTALMNANIGGNVDVCKLLLEAGAEVDAVDNLGDTALMYACKNGNAMIVFELLTAGADIECSGVCNDTPLTIASIYQHHDCVRVLLNFGANIQRGRSGLMTALTCAAMYSNGYAYGCNFRNTMRQFPHSIASIKKSRDITVRNSLLSADDLILMTRPSILNSCVFLLLDAGASVETVDAYDDTALLYASKWGDLQSIQLLLKFGSHVNHLNNRGETVLHCVCAKTSCESVRVELLLCSAEIDVNLTDRDGRTPLMLACRCGDTKVETVSLLLKAGALMDVKDEHCDMTALMEAVICHSVLCVKVLLEAGTDERICRFDTLEDALYLARIHDHEKAKCIQRMLEDAERKRKLAVDTCSQSK